jgi:hypothetical protein
MYEHNIRIVKLFVRFIENKPDSIYKRRENNVERKPARRNGVLTNRKPTPNLKP